MKEHVIYDFLNKYCKYGLSNIVNDLREHDFIGLRDLAQNEWKMMFDSSHKHMYDLSQVVK